MPMEMQDSTSHRERKGYAQMLPQQACSSKKFFTVREINSASDEGDQRFFKKFWTK